MYTSINTIYLINHLNITTMKTLRNNSEVAHSFAHQQHSAAKGSNLFYINDTIYSYGYHFAIAKLVNGKALLTTRSYSVSTAKHIRIVSSAVSHIDAIYVHDPSSDFEHNMDKFKQVIDLNVSKLEKARNKSPYLIEISSSVDNLLKYCAVMGETAPEWALAFSLSEYAEQIKAEQLKQEQKRIEKSKEEINKFLSFEINNISTRIDRDYIRVKGDEVQTSQGLKFPLYEAKELFNNKESIQPGFDLFGYTVIKKTKDFIKVGCHTLYFNDLEMLSM